VEAILEIRHPSIARTSAKTAAFARAFAAFDVEGPPAMRDRNPAGSSHRFHAKLIDEHADFFAGLYAAVLGRDVAFDGPTEQWIVWPVAGEGGDPRGEELAARGIRVVGYVEHDGGYEMSVGRGAGGTNKTG
jgi:hypothetical protein